MKNIKKKLNIYNYMVKINEKFKFAHKQCLIHFKCTLIASHLVVLFLPFWNSTDINHR